MGSSFIDANTGWSIYRIETSDRDGFEYSLYRTTNGQDWTEAAPAVEVGKLSTVSGLSVLDEDSMWLSGHFPDSSMRSQLVIYASRDGGGTWQDQPLKPIPDKVDNPEYTSFPPWFFNGEDGLLIVGVESGEWKNRYAYVTSDGGRTWSDPVKLAYPGEPAASYSVGDMNWTMENAVQLIVEIGDEHWATDELGGTWRRVSSK